MFWRFGFHNASTIDTLLDRDDTAVEDLLDEDELLQECKAQNTRLIDYFQRIDVLQKLLRYVAGSIEGEERGRFKYPYIATEVLCSEIWSIVEVCVSNSDQLLKPFWETVLDRSPDDMRTRSAMATHFSKINSVFLKKKPAEMLAFIKAQPSIIERLIMHIEMPPIVDLLFRLIQLDANPSGAGVLEWLSLQKLIPCLVDLLSPSKPCGIHAIASEVIKGIITMSAPSPGATAVNDSLQHIPACNQFARELASKENISKLLHFMLDEVPDDSTGSLVASGNGSLNKPAPTTVLAYPSYDEEESNDSITTESVTSSLIQSISVIIELIRKNNSDYFEPYLFHNIRNRLIQVQQQLHMHPEDSRDVLEQNMKELVDRMGVVNLGVMLESFCKRLNDFQNLLHSPRSLHGHMFTSVGEITPLTLERFRICELYAELLHCSNMALLNRLPGTGPIYDEDGRLQGGLSALEELARVISIGNGEDNGSDDVNNDSQDMVEAKELPVHSLSTLSSRSTDSSSLASDSDSELSDQSSDDALDDIPVSEHSEIPFPIRKRSREVLSLPVSSTSNISSTANTPSQETNGSNSQNSHNSSTADISLSSSSDPLCASSKILPIGDILKSSLIEANVVGTLLDFFFQFPWNNFLHNTVYDFLHQILTGHTETGLNRSMIIALFRDAKLFHRIVEGNDKNEHSSRQPKSIRLGYMGHLTLISEDVISALEHYPEDLAAELRQYAPQPDWDRYVEGGYKETKRRDTTLLGGGKPVIVGGTAFQKGRWPKVDEEDAGLVNGLTTGTGKSGDVGAVVTTSALQADFRRIASAAPFPRNTVHFEPTQEEEEAASSSQFARYLAEEIHATPVSQFVSTSYSDASDDEDDEDEENGTGWLARSAGFNVPSPPPTIGRNQASSPTKSSRELSDPFMPSSSNSRTSDSSLAFSPGEDNDGFGPFSDTSVSSDGFVLDQDDSQFDFGDFQAAEYPSDGEITPTGDSWTFENSLSTVEVANDSNNGVDELKHQLESASLEYPDTTDNKRSRHERTASMS